MDLKVVNYKCPNCAAPMIFSIELQKFECHFCNSSFEKEELEKLSASEGYKEPETADWTAELFNEDDMLAHTCPDCGGRIISEKNTVSTFCPFCHNPTVLAQRLQNVYKPAKIIPFKISKEDALIQFKELFRGRPFLPARFRDYLDKGEIAGLYVPFWLYSADLKGRLDLEGTRVTMWSDTNYTYTKSDIYRVNREATVPFINIPADASKRLDDKLMDSIEPFNYEDMKDFSMEYLSGFFAEGFDVNAEEAKHRFLARANSALQSILIGQVSGYSATRILSLTSSQFSPKNYYALLPVWTISIKYNNRIYLYAINAQTGKSAGELPFSAARMFAWFLGLSAISAVIVAVILYFGGLL